MPSIAPAAKRSRVYYTGLVPFVEQRLQKEIRGRGWSMKMGIRPDKCRHDYKSTRPSQHYSPAQPEIVICARDIHRADAALALFMDCLQLLRGPRIWDIDLRPIPEDDRERHELREMLRGGSIMFSEGDFDLAAMLAKTASANRRFAYAIALQSAFLEKEDFNDDLQGFIERRAKKLLAFADTLLEIDVPQMKHVWGNLRITFGEPP